MRPNRLPFRIALLALCLCAATGHAATYEYDDLGRLVRETYDNGAEIVYAYDAVGNRTSRTVVVPPPEPPFFADGFESGDTGGWSSAIPTTAQASGASATAGDLDRVVRVTVPDGGAAVPLAPSIAKQRSSMAN